MEMRHTPARAKLMSIVDPRKERAVVIDTTGRASSVADRTQATGTPKIKRHFFPELQGIRAVAILLMVFVHTSFSSGALYYTGHQGDGFLAILIERFCRNSLPIMLALFRAAIAESPVTAIL